MKIENLKEIITNVAISEDDIREIEGIYGCKINESASRVISVLKEGGFLEGENFVRKLSIEEIKRSDGELGADFKKAKLIPVMDIAHNNFVAYDYEKNLWCCFNIVDKTKYNETADFISLL